MDRPSIERPSIEQRQIERFESELKRRTRDPLERARARHKFYEKYRKSKENEIPMTTSEKEEGYGVEIKSFAAYERQAYQGIEWGNDLDVFLKERGELLSEEVPRFPTFLLPNGDICDQYYIPMTHEEAQEVEISASTLCSGYQNESRRSAACPHVDASIFSYLPDVRHYGTFEKYASAMVQWKTECERELGLLQLPSSLGWMISRARAERMGIAGLSEERERGVFGGFMPWENQLFPAEPQPQHYDVYEEYELAMLRWAHVCAQLRFLPPNPEQMEKLVGLMLTRINVKEERGKRLIRRETNDDEDELVLSSSGEEVWIQLTEEGREKIREIFRAFLLERLGSRRKSGWFDTPVYPTVHGICSFDSMASGLGICPRSKLRKEYKASSFGVIQSASSLGPRVALPKAEGPQKVVSRIQRRRSIMIRTTIRPLPPQFQHTMDISVRDVSTSVQATMRNLSILFPRFGGFDSTCVNGPMQRRDVFEPRAPKKFSTRVSRMDCLHQQPLRRENITALEDRMSRDAESYENGFQVDFSVPAFDIGMIDLDFISDVNYAQMVRTAVEKLDGAHRFESLNSWYHPKVPDEDKEEDLDMLANIARTVIVPGNEIAAANQLKLFLKMFRTPVYFDLFQAFLDAPIPSDLPGVVEAERMIDVILHAVDPSYFIDILKLFQLTQAELSRSKIAIFIREGVKTSFVDPCIRKLVQEKDIQSFCQLCLCLTYFDDIPLSLFEFPVFMIREMGKIAIPNDPEVGVELVRNIALFYYLNIVLTAMNEGAFSFPCSYPILSRFNHELRRQILDAIDKENVFLEAGIWNGLQHPNQDIAMGFLCALSTLLNTDDQDVQACLHAPGVSVVRKIRAIAEGRHKHTSTCLEILFPVLSSENWIDETFDVYGEIEVVLGDIAFSARTPILKRRNISVRSRLVSEMLVEFIRCTSEKCSAVMQSLINKSFYKRAIDHLGMRFISKEGIENLCYVLSEFGALCHKLEVKMTEDKKAAKKSERQKFRSVYANLSRNEIRLMALYCDSANGKVQMSCRAKTLLLQCLKRLLKMPVNYDPIRKDLEFHEKYLSFNPTLSSSFSFLRNARCVRR
eukprot:TRINITY_DN5682_c0_g1_i2.p1 TRINITY_DN5682_c0_g1~~TRINITY_DN5682_c0_g1_i2.p1  ORF type:complete len:1111 (-),score=274.64 TRINITY_DN5682_c0_g1_i2:16-3279(-)